MLHCKVHQKLQMVPMQFCFKKLMIEGSSTQIVAIFNVSSPMRLRHKLEIVCYFFKHRNFSTRICLLHRPKSRHYKFTLVVQPPAAGIVCRWVVPASGQMRQLRLWVGGDPASGDDDGAPLFRVGVLQGHFLMRLCMKM